MTDQNDAVWDKAILFRQLLQQYDDDIMAATAAAQTAQEAAAHEDNQPENQYDTLSLEAAYLAHGQSERILQLQQQRIQLSQWAVDQTLNEVVSLGSIVVLQSDQKIVNLWITPLSGRPVTRGETSILVISSATPLALELIGKEEGDDITWPGSATPHNQQQWQIVHVF